MKRLQISARAALSKNGGTVIPPFLFDEIQYLFQRKTQGKLTIEVEIYFLI